MLRAVFLLAASTAVLGCDTIGLEGSESRVTVDEFSPRVLRVGATFDPAALTIADSTSGSIVWTSSDPTVVTVTNGLASAQKAGSATLTAESTTGSDTAQVLVIAPFTVQPLLLSNATMASMVITGMNDSGTIVGYRANQTTQSGFVVKGTTVTELDCIPWDINNLDAILCRTVGANPTTVVRHSDGSSTDVAVQGFIVQALNDSGDVSLMCQTSCNNEDGTRHAYGVRLASGGVVKKGFNEFYGLSSRSAFNNARDVGISIGHGYQVAHIYRSSTNEFVPVGGGYGRWSHVTALNDNRDAVSYGEGPMGSNARRSSLLTYNGTGWTGIKMASKAINTDPWVVGMSGTPTDLNNSRDVIGSGAEFSSFTGPYFWTIAARGGFVAMDSLLADQDYTILSAARITNDRRIAAVARNKTTGEQWLVRLVPRQ